MVYKKNHWITDDVLQITAAGAFDVDGLRAVLKSTAQELQERGQDYGALLLHLEDGPMRHVNPLDMANAWLGCARLRPWAILDGARRPGFYGSLALLLADAQPRPALFEAFQADAPDAEAQAMAWCRAKAKTWRFESARRRS